MQQTLDVSNEVAAELAGIGDSVLDALRDRLGTTIRLRGNQLTIEGDDGKVMSARAVVDELVELVEGGHEIGPSTVDAVLGALDQAEDIRDVFEDVVWRHRGKKIAPKTLTQKQYVDAIRQHVVTFGIGPAGTGKTYLAMALAVAALHERQVGRIILTRPAVEAGEKLGFLPGDMLAKVDPYLRPLFDALYDMLDADRLAAYMDRGTIEVAPLAFMRGRAQPVDTPVLTPSGFAPIGSLRVGDLVVGSNGRPTPVLGVYPQGRRSVYRVTTQDGASTLACGEHLWFVTTRSDYRHGKPGRILQTRELIDAVWRGHRREFEIPLVGAVEFEEQPLPLDPYAVGLLLGDGCLTTSTIPSFATGDPELAAALDAALPEVDVVHKSGPDYMLQPAGGGGRGGVITANPLTHALRELGLAGARSSTKFVPAAYLLNSSVVRLAVLQGLLDADGGPVTQRARTCRIQYTTCSPRLRDDVVFLVQSLGGIAYARTRRRAGRPAGGSLERPIYHRSDAYVLDIRLPAGLAPFRSSRKKRAYEADGGRRPTRFIDSVEPAGDAECVCIAVGAADSLYVTSDFLVTHNTLNDSFVILDEAQNTSPEQMQMFLTRLGFGSRIVVTGDVTQIDLPREQASGLIQVQQILASVEGIAFVGFTHRDVVRHKLVQRIVEAYKQHAEETGTARQR